MAKKQTRVEKEAAQFSKKVTDLMGRGYAAISPNVALNFATAPQTGTFSVNEKPEYLCSRPEALGGGRMQNKFAFFDGKQSNPKPTPDNVGTKGLGYIPWGPQDNLPNQIFQYANALPYTAAALKYITDLTVGLGPKLMYTWPRYVNGTLKEDLVPYEHAGVLLRGCMRELREKMKQDAAAQGGGVPSSAEPVQGEVREDSHTIHFMDARRASASTAQPKPEEKDKPLPGSYEEEMMHL